MSNRDRVLDFLRSISPACATNSEIVSRTGIRPHQQVYQKTQELLTTGILFGRRVGNEWEFSINGDEDRAHMAQPAGRASRIARTDCDCGLPNERMTAASFEETARMVMGAHFNKPLYRGKVGSVPKTFDMVSIDCHVVGDAKSFTLVQGARQPPAKFSIIVEHVWLLEKTQATNKFLVFGNDRQVPEQWLKRYGSLVHGIEFYFLEPTGKLQLLHSWP